jgi:hypothetical protein
MTSNIFLDPTGEHRIVARQKAQRPKSLDGITVGILDIGKTPGNVFLDHLAERMIEKGIGVKRYAKPGPGTLVSAEIKQRMQQEVQTVAIGLAD